MVSLYIELQNTIAYYEMYACGPVHVTSEQTF